MICCDCDSPDVSSESHPALVLAVANESARSDVLYLWTSTKSAGAGFLATAIGFCASQSEKQVVHHDVEVHETTVSVTCRALTLEYRAPESPSDEVFHATQLALLEFYSRVLACWCVSMETRHPKHHSSLGACVVAMRYRHHFRFSSSAFGPQLVSPATRCCHHPSQQLVCVALTTGSYFSFASAAVCVSVERHRHRHRDVDLDALLLLDVLVEVVKHRHHCRCPSSASRTLPWGRLADEGVRHRHPPLRGRGVRLSPLYCEQPFAAEMNRRCCTWTLRSCCQRQ